MTATKIDVVTRAHRDLKVVSAYQSPDGDQQAFGEALLDDLFDELKTAHGFTFTWTTDTVPAGALGPLATILAVDMAPHYSEMPPTTRAKAIMRLRSWAYLDDRDDRRDTDDDGSVSDTEADAGRRAGFY